MLKYFFVFSLVFQMPTPTGHAQDYKETIQPEKKGVGMMVGGILLTSIGGAASIISYVMSISSSCRDESGGNPCKTDKVKLRYISGASLVAGTGVGIPMIAIGGGNYRKWKRWQRSHISLNAMPAGNDYRLGSPMLAFNLEI
jgi:hypothetical protein